MITGTLAPPPAPFPCPFQAGDVICHVEDKEATFSRAVVTKAGDTTFVYQYEKPIPFISREGSAFHGGETYNHSARHWTLVKRCSPSLDQSRVLP